MGDRPRLSRLIPVILREAGAQSVVAVIPQGAYWLNNRNLSAYLSRVPDSLRVTAELRRVGLSDRFQGGFLVRHHEFSSMVPLLASQPFCGGPDVYFAARPIPVLITACHEFDLHVESPNADLTTQLASLCDQKGLEVRGLDVGREEASDRSP
jgi:hypothetical protein